MKANELQIGDLIYVYGQNGNLSTEPDWYARKVTADWLVDMVRGEEEDRRIADNGITIPAGQLFIGDTKPIPITEEILKMNGIPTNGNTHLFDTDINYYLELLWADGELLWTINLAEYCIMPFTYVHELQHALRLCGLNDLADNFKVGGEE